MDVDAAVDVEVEEVDVAVAVLPGMVCALTTLNAATPPTAANATTAVRRLSRRIPALRALIRESVAVVCLSMTARVPCPTGT